MKREGRQRIVKRECGHEGVKREGSAMACSWQDGMSKKKGESNWAVPTSPAVQPRPPWAPHYQSRHPQPHGQSW